MGGEILQRMQAADAAQGLHHVLGDRARVERIAAVLGDRPQGLAKLGLVDHVAGHRRLAMRQQIALGVGAFLQFLELLFQSKALRGATTYPSSAALIAGCSRVSSPNLP